MLTNFCYWLCRGCCVDCLNGRFSICITARSFGMDRSDFSACRHVTRHSLTADNDAVKDGSSVKTTNPRRYCVRPNTDIVLPGATCNVKVTMQAQREAPPDMQCKDKFLLQSVIANPGATVKNITPEMFNKETGKLVDEFKLRVVYIPANLPSPVPEGSEEGSSPRASSVDNGNANASLFDSASSLVYKLTEEKKSAIEQNQKLHQELTLKEIITSLSILVSINKVLVFMCLASGLVTKKSIYF
ncbi:Vesicle-associated protein 1-3 [Asimina triloba]